MKVLTFYPTKPEILELIKEKHPEIELIEAEPSQTIDNTPEDITVILAKTLNLKNVTHYPKSLKLIQLASAGFDGIDLDLLKDHHIKLCNAHGVPTVGVAEYVMGAILAKARLLLDSVIDHSWERFDHYQNLDGKKLLIVGAGDIGEAIAKRAEPFGVEIVGVRRSHDLKPHFTKMITLDELADELPTSDYVVNILPSNETSNDLFNKSLFNHFKSSAIFVNVGRGNAVVDNDLLAALDNKQLDYAILDVFHQEPLPEDHPFYHHPNILVTPHIAGSSEGYLTAVWTILLKQIDHLKDNTEFDHIIV